MEDAPPPPPPFPLFFPQFTRLHEDLMMCVLSFAADAPFEHPHQRSTLTHVLPFVSKQFHTICQSNYMWKTCLERLVRKEKCLWQDGLLRLLPLDGNEDLHNDGNEENDDNEEQALVEAVHTRLQSPGYLELFQRIVSQRLRFTGPVFIMQGHVRLGEPFGLHFFEPRYRLLIADVMEPYPLEQRQGEPVVARNNDEYPTFVYAHTSPFAATSPACLVQVRQCTIHPDGTADVMLVPAAYVWVERLWERPQSGHLYYAQCLRMGRDATRQMEQRAFREREQMRVREMFHFGAMQHRGLVNEILDILMARNVGGEQQDGEEEDEEVEEEGEDSGGSDHDELEGNQQDDMDE